MVNKEMESVLIEDWYEINQLDNGIVSIGEPHHREEVFCYLVKGEDKDLLIDTGMGVISIMKALEKIRNSNKDLVVVNSHAHFDHIGGNSQFEKVLVPDNEWEINKICEGWDHNSLEWCGFSEGFERRPSDFETEVFEIPGYEKITPILKEGFKIDLGDRTVKVLETPGHTPGSVCFLEENNGLLFTSDLLYQGPLFCFGEESSVENYYASLKKLQNMEKDIKFLYPGHNYSTSPVNLIDSAIECFERVIDKDKPDFEEKFHDKILLGYSQSFLPRLSVLVDSNVINS